MSDNKLHATSWTEIEYPVTSKNPFIVEPIFEPKDVRYILCRTNGERVESRLSFAVFNTLDGTETLSAALDLAGFFDPSGIADGANAALLASEGDYWGAIQSGLSVLPLGDLAKVSKIGKDIRIIGDAISASNKGYLHRPYIRKRVREVVESKTPRDEIGRFLDANTRAPISGKYDLGHVWGKEYWRLKADAEAKGLTQKEFNELMNNPDLYQIEDPHINRSRRYEKKK